MMARLTMGLLWTSHLPPNQAYGTFPKTKSVPSDTENKCTRYFKNVFNIIQTLQNTI